jgi:hypothetical protein
MTRAITAFLIGFALAGCAGAIQNQIFGKCSAYSAPGGKCK